MQLPLSTHQPTTRFARIFLLSGAAALLPLGSTGADQPKNSDAAATLENFSEGERDQMDWRVVVDGVMGGLSTGKMSMTEEGHAKFSGVLSLENNGGFSSIRTAKIGPLDLSNRSGVAVRVKGDGRTYQFRLESDARYRGSWPVSFKSDFETKKGEWVVVEIPFSSFEGGWRGRDLPDATLNPATIERMGIILADKKPGMFEIEVDWVRTYGGGGGQ